MLPKRFDYHNPRSKSGDPEETGLLPCELDYLYGTPNINRVENVTLVGSSSTLNECLFVQFKWRPPGDSQETGFKNPTVTLTSQLRLILNDCEQYDYDHMESYVPRESRLRPGRITQYGSNVARLKLVVASPYRRMRLVFAGPMRRRHLLASKEDEEEVRDELNRANELVFVRFSCIIHPVGPIHNFSDEFHDINTFLTRSKHQPGATCKAASKRAFRTTARSELLALCDRHEQRVRFAGEYLVVEQVSSERDGIEAKHWGRTHGIFTSWGFHARHFAPKVWPMGVSALPTRRLYVQLKNGQAFQVGVRRIRESPGAKQLVDVQFGYTSFGVNGACETLRESLELDWAQLADGSREGANLFEAAVCGQGVLIECSQARKWADWFEVRTCSSTGNTRSWPGWAFVSRDDEILDSGDFEAQMVANRQSLWESIERRLQVDPDALYLAGEQTTSGPLVVTADEEACLSPELVGWKAASLAQLVKLAPLVSSQQVNQKTGFLVPQVYVLTKFVYLRMLQRNTWLQNVISELMESLSHNDESELAGQGDKSLAAQCAKLVEFIEEAQVSRLVRKHLLTRMNEDNEHHVGAEQQESVASSRGVAVSVSSWVENAGELDDSFCRRREVTDLTISSAELSSEFEAAIMASLASKFAYERIRYERQHGFPLDLPVAVIIEQNILCETRGSLLTCDPATGDDLSIIIIVKSSTSTPAHDQVIRVYLSGEKPEIVRVINRQVNLAPELAKLDQVFGTGQFVGHADANESLQVDALNSSLTDEQILHLTQVGLAVKNYMALKQQQCHLDWGYATGSGRTRPFLFGCRPLTAMDTLTSEELLCEADRPSHSELLFYTQAGLSSDYVPYALNPLTLSMSHQRDYMRTRLYRECLGSKSDRDWAPNCGVDTYSEKYHTFLGLLGNHFVDLHLDLDAGRRRQETGNESTSHLVAKAMEISFFGRPLAESSSSSTLTELMDMVHSYWPPPASNPDALLGGSFKQILLKWTPKMEIGREARRVLQTHKHLLAELARAPLLAPAAGPDLDPLRHLRAAYARLKQVSGQMYACWRNHMLISLLERHEREHLTRLLARYLRDPMQLAHAVNKFLGQVSEKPEVAGEMRSQIGELARMLEARSDVREFLESESPEGALEYLLKRDEQIGQKFDHFLDKFGHRSCSEFDLMAASWREQPETLVGLIKSHCHLPVRSEGAESTPGGSANGRGASLNRTVRPATISVDQMLDSIGLRERISTIDLLRLKLSLVPRCRSYLTSLAQTRDVLVLHFDCMRLASRALARELQANFRLPDRELVYFALMDELEPLVNLHQPAIVEQANRRRAMFRRLFQGDEWKFGSGEPIIRQVIPDHWREQTDLLATRSHDEQRYQTLRGKSASGGCVHARVILIEPGQGRSWDKLQASGCILVTYKLDAELAQLLDVVVGMITELDQITSYGAACARNLGLPCIIGVPNVTKLLTHNEEILMDADMGTIVRLECDQEDGVGQARQQSPPPDGNRVVVA